MTKNKNNTSSPFGNLNNQINDINKEKKSKKKEKKKKEKSSNKKGNEIKTNSEKEINKKNKDKNFIKKSLGQYLKKLKKLDIDKIKKQIKKLITKLKKINYKKKFKLVIKIIQKQKKYTFGIVLFIIIIQIGLLTKSYLAYNGTLKKLEASTDQLKQLNTYEGINTDQNYLNSQIGSGSFFKTFYETQFEYQILEKELSNFQSPYNNFLRKFYLPSLNIRKDPINKEINTRLIGQEYLQNNNFIDTKLINKWSDFFSMSNGLTAPNEIENIDIGDFEPVDNIGGNEPLFKIPIKTNLISPSRRTFLATTNKLATTSRKENIGLINEFFYYLLQSLKNDNNINSIATKIYQNNKSTEEKSSSQDLDQTILNSIYNWSVENKNNEISSQITADIIYKTIHKTAGCSGNPEEHNNIEIEKCLFSFRKKYQNIGSLKKIAITNNKPNPNGLKNFIKNLSPLLNINHFSFKQDDNEDLENDDYSVEIEIEIFGTDINIKEIEQISNKLWTQCYPNKEKINNNFINKAITQIKNERNEVLQNIGNNSLSSTKITEIKKILELFNEKKEEIEKENINYNKAIKIFEVYRMLNENGYCN